MQVEEEDRRDEAIPYVKFGNAGPRLHFAHANSYPPGCYRQFLRPLAAHFHVLAMEQRPLWPEASPEEMESWDLFGDDLIHFCRQQQLVGIVGAGHSLGAVATVMAAVRRPRLFRRLVLIEPVFLPPAMLAAAANDPDEAYERPLVKKALKRRNRWASRRAAFDRFRTKSVFAGLSDEALWDYVGEALYELDDGRFALRFPREWEARIYSRPPTAVWELLPKVSQPTLAVRAADSRTLSEEAWERWKSLQPHAHFVEVPRTTHLAPLEQPRELAEEVLRFLK